MFEDDDRLGFNPCWLTERQWEALADIVATPGGKDAIVAHYKAVRASVGSLRERGASEREIIQAAMRTAYSSNTGLSVENLLPITRGMLTSIFQEDQHHG